MAESSRLHFADCELDFDAYEVRRGGKLCAVEPQVFELLTYLARNPDRLITKDELIEKVWGGRIVSDAALSSRIKSARQAIGDDGKQQRLIKTVHGRGVRFIANIVAAATATLPPPRPTPSVPRRAAPVGRGSQRQRLMDHLALAQQGKRQIVFVTGEPGLGKTTLIDSFVGEAQADGAVRVGSGQCLEHRGSSEAYMPVLEALGRLCRADDAKALIAVLTERAPSWLVQMPWLISGPELETLQRRTQGITRERMLRELVEAIEAMTAERTLILVLEDLHWSDPSTADLIARLAQRREPARFLLVGTFRPSDLAVAQHPLVPVLSELRAHGLCAELALPLLDEAAVTDYLAARLGSDALPTGLTHLLYERTEGNPLFFKNVIDAWIDRRQLIEHDGAWILDAPPEALSVGAPENLRQLVEQQLARLDPDNQAVLEVGSVVGREFAAAVVAAASGRTEEDVEAAASILAQRGQFLRERADADWSDASASARFVFLHDLYREVLYARIPNSRRRQWHRRIGEALEADYGARTAEHAAELVLHFLRGRDPERAVAYAQQAADLALQRGAHREAFTHLTGGLAALSRIENMERRCALEAGLQIARAAACIASEGYGADSTEQAFLRAYELIESQPDPTLRFKALYGLFVFRWNRGRMSEAAALADEMLATADATGDAAVQSVANRALAVVDNARGAFARAHLHAQRAASLYDPARHAASARFYIQDIGVGAFIHGALAAWHLGHGREAVATADDALRLARRTEHANTICYAMFFVAYLHMLARRGDAALTLASELVGFADERYIRFWSASGRGVLGAAHVIAGDYREGRGVLTDALERMRAIRLETFQPTFLTFLAEADAALGATEDARRHFDEALSRMAGSQEHWFEPEALRLHGRLLKQTGAPPEAVRRDLEAAHQAAASQQSRWYQLRATLDLARLLAEQDKRRRARDFLATSLQAFPPDADAPELTEAKALLDSLGRSEAGPAAPRTPAAATTGDRSQAAAAAPHQDIHYCTARDGVRIAYASVGAGPPLVRPAHWMTHLEFDLQSPVWRHWIHELARDHRLIRYDERANGLSDWSVDNLNFDDFVSDLEAVVQAAGLDRFPMFCLSQGCAIAVAYAVRHPERVSRLVLCGGYARGWAKRGNADDIARRHALGTLIEHGWGQDNPAFRQVFTSLFIPDADAEQMRWFNELQLKTASPANALRLHNVFGQIDVRPLLARVRVPTLVLHARNDGVVPFEEGRLLASEIPGARFVPLDSRNHVLLEAEPAWPRFLDEVRAFLAAEP